MYIMYMVVIDEVQFKFAEKTDGERVKQLFCFYEHSAVQMSNLKAIMVYSN